MKKIVSVVLAVAAGSLGAASLRADEGWQVQAEHDGLLLATRAVPPSAIDEVRAIATFELPIEAILAVLADVEHYPDNLPPTVVARRLRGSGHDAWFYMEIRPGVVARRYYCIHSRVSRLPSNTVRVEWGLANELCPLKQEGMVRMEDNAGAWTLTPLGPGTTRVLYQAHADPGGSIPASMVNWVAPRTVADMFESLRKASQRAQLSATRK